jgi:Fe-S cluster assembly ATP-binding protein
MLSIKNLSVSIDQKLLLQDINLALNPGSVHVLMGPNGSGKSSFAHALMGHPDYQINTGSITLNDLEYATFSADKRARAGFFLAFQQPIEIPGVSFFSLLKESYQAVHQKNCSIKEFQELLNEKIALLNLDVGIIHRSVNEGFSGGEKKKLELLQMMVLNPKVAILDEIDSGLDIDAIKIVADCLEKIMKANPSMIVLIISHYPRIFEYLSADFVHILIKGSICKSGDVSLISEIEKRGYDGFSQ